MHSSATGLARRLRRRMPGRPGTRQPFVWARDRTARGEAQRSVPPREQAVPRLTAAWTYDMRSAGQARASPQRLDAYAYRLPMPLGCYLHTKVRPSADTNVLDDREIERATAC